jgi:AN1-type zinc finger and ubiquitin domain-containing protein 1
MALGSMATSKDQDQQRHKSIASSRPSTVMRQEREAMQAKVDRLKGQLKEMKRWRSHQSLARRNLLQAKASPEMTTHRSFEHLPTIPEKRPNVTCQPNGSRRRTGRCDECGKKTGIATVFPCRCGGTFCTKHRYAECHRCSFDYKTAGKKILTRENPVVTAPKLPKI